MPKQTPGHGPQRYGAWDGDQATVDAILKLRLTGLTCRRIALIINGEDHRMRSGRPYTTAWRHPTTP